MFLHRLLLLLKSMQIGVHALHNTYCCELVFVISIFISFQSECIYTCIYVYICTCLCIYMHIYICIYTYIKYSTKTDLCIMANALHLFALHISLYGICVYMCNTYVYIVQVYMHIHKFAITCMYSFQNILLIYCDV